MFPIWELAIERLNTIREPSRLVNVIAKRAIVEAQARYPEAAEALSAWYYDVKHAVWNNSAELKDQYGTASIVNSERVVFNICGNKYRVVVRINYVSRTIFVRFIGTHAEYDLIDARTI